MNPLAIIEKKTPLECVNNLNKLGFETISLSPTKLVDKPISGHPDIQFFLHEKNIFVHPDIDKSFLEKIENRLNIVECNSHLMKFYPGDIPYNIACVGKTAIHRVDSTDVVIKEYFAKNGIISINTRQGYSKCSTMIVNDKSIITSDKSIYKSASYASIEALLITQGYIDLPGYNYGFIGGASGKYNDTIYLTGTLDHHPDADLIKSFLRERNIKLHYLSKFPIFDAGSIFFI